MTFSQGEPCEWCTERAYQRGLCVKHYFRWYRNKKRRMPLPEELIRDPGKRRSGVRSMTEAMVLHVRLFANTCGYDPKSGTWKHGRAPHRFWVELNEACGVDIRHLQRVVAGEFYTDLPRSTRAIEARLARMEDA